MANDKVYKYYTELPPWAKGIVVVGGLGVAYLLGSNIYRKFFVKPSQDVINAENDITKFEATMKPSYSDASYDGYANIIYEAQRTSMSNDSGEIMDIALLMKNNLDIAKLIKAYGTRQDYAFGVPTESYTLLGAMRKGITSDLFGAFAFRIDKINEDWEAKGISYKL